jgi:anti-sigma B factor antagonist
MLGPLTIVTWQPAPDVAVMRVAGEVDLFTAPSFQDTVHQQLGRPLLVLVIDLSPVTFFGASGLTVLVAAHELAEQRAIALRLVCETRTVTRLLAMVGLDETSWHGELPATRWRERQAWSSQGKSTSCTMSRVAAAIGMATSAPMTP